MQRLMFELVSLPANICYHLPPPSSSSKVFGFQGHFQLLSVALTDNHEILSLPPRREAVCGGLQSS